MANGVTWDGHDLTELFVCGSPSRVLLSRTANYVDIPGGDPAFRSVERGPKALSFVASIESGDKAKRKTAMLQLAAWLAVDGPCRLEFHDDNGLYYMAVPDGDFEVAEHLNATAVQLGFCSVDGILYGVERTASIPSGGSVAVSVGGTAPTPVRVTANAAVRDSTSKLWTLTDSPSMRKLSVETGSSSSRKLEIDCGSRTLTVAGSVSLPTLDSDWLVLEPGEHVLSVTDGTGAATATWRERWY